MTAKCDVYPFLREIDLSGFFKSLPCGKEINTAEFCSDEERRSARESEYSLSRFTDLFIRNLEACRDEYTIGLMDAETITNELVILGMKYGIHKVACLSLQTIDATYKTIVSFRYFHSEDVLYIRTLGNDDLSSFQSYHWYDALNTSLFEAILVKYVNLVNNRGNIEDPIFEKVYYDYLGKFVVCSIDTFVKRNFKTFALDEELSIPGKQRVYRVCDKHTIHFNLKNFAPGTKPIFLTDVQKKHALTPSRYHAFLREVLRNVQFSDEEHGYSAIRSAMAAYSISDDANDADISKFIYEVSCRQETMKSEELVDYVVWSIMKVLNHPSS